MRGSTCTLKEKAANLIRVQPELIRHEAHASKLRWQGVGERVHAEIVANRHGSHGSELRWNAGRESIGVERKSDAKRGHSAQLRPDRSHTQRQGDELTQDAHCTGPDTYGRDDDKEFLCM